MHRDRESVARSFSAAKVFSEVSSLLASPLDIKRTPEKPSPIMTESREARARYSRKQEFRRRTDFGSRLLAAEDEGGGGQ